MRRVTVLLLLGGCVKAGPYRCGENAECVAEGQPSGRCEANGYCSFRDPMCSTGWRFGDLAGDGLGSTCVGGGGPVDGGGDASSVGTPMPAAHVVSAGAFAGDSPLRLQEAEHVIDTDQLTVDDQAPGAIFDVWEQVAAGPALAVLHVSRFDLAEGSHVRVAGSRPLVVIAAGPVSIAGVLDLAAANVTPGAGGSGPGMGPGMGQPGTHGLVGDDAGGSGAGHASEGAAGGATSYAPAPAPGVTYGDPILMVLVGGSG